MKDSRQTENTLSAGKYFNCDIDIIQMKDEISATAKQNHEQQFPAELAGLIEVIIHAFTAEIKAELDISNPGRAWWVFNLNDAIIATCSHDPKRMESIFEQIVFRLPENAPDNFTQGMQQMDNIDYPEHVRTSMQTCFQLINQPTLH
jgi:hypothetical protein